MITFFTGKWRVIKTENFCGESLFGITSARDAVSRE